MGKTFLQFFWKITNKSIIGTIIGTLLVGIFLPVKFIPDYFHLNDLTEKKKVVLSLLATVIGFSGLILTILLVVYNFYIKVTRRHTLEFIADSRWLKVTFSSFFGMIIFLTVAFFFVESGSSSHNLTILYLSFILTFIFIIGLFPLTLLSLNDSVSMGRIRKIIGLINDEDMKDLYSPSEGDHISFAENIERNPIIIAREFLLSAIADRDWVLPQTVLIELYNRFILPITKSSSLGMVKINLYNWALICNYLKSEVIKQNESITGRVLLDINLVAHKHLALSGNIEIRDNGIDSFLIDYFRMMLEQNKFFDLQAKFAVRTTELIEMYFETIKFSDEEAFTADFYYNLPLTERKAIPNTKERNHWFYLTRELPDIIFLTFRNAIFFQRQNSYSHFSSNFYNLYERIFKASNLTKFQKREAIREIMRSAEGCSEYAIKHQVFDDIEPISVLHMYGWLRDDPDLGFSALYTYDRMIRSLAGVNSISARYVDNYFSVARMVSNDQLDGGIVQKVVDLILERTIKVLRNVETSNQIRNHFLYQLDWFVKEYLYQLEALNLLKGKYFEEIEKLLMGYSRNNW